MDPQRAQNRLEGQRGIWSQLMSKYTATGGNYPLGMASGVTNCFTSTTISNEADDDARPSLKWHPSNETPSRTVGLATNLNPEFLWDADVLRSIMTSDQSQTMTVKCASVCHNNPEDDYKMTARPRGLCLIVNNVDFEHDLFPTRRGSDQDANRFDQLFTQLGFHTIMARNLTADQMRLKFRELSAACRREHDALFVFILSHGSDCGIYGTDGLEVYLESEIISCFDNGNCRQMIGKPKVFIIQACRGNLKDCGGGDTTDSVAVNRPQAQQVELNEKNRVPSSWLPRSNVASTTSEPDRQRPIRTDMLLVFSCLAGFVSVRNETAGSWLGVALAYFIMTHAHERDLLKILNLVTGDIIQRKSSMGHLQSIEVKLLGWTKSLYFNPGIYL